MIAEEEEEVAIEEAQAERVELRLNQIAQVFELKAREAEAVLSWARQGLASTGAAINSLDSIRAQGSSTISQVALLNQMLFRLNIEPVIPSTVRQKGRQASTSLSQASREDDAAAQRLARSTAASVTDDPLVSHAATSMGSLSLNGAMGATSPALVESYSRISVHNLPYSATKQQVMSLFAPFGRLAGLRLKHGYAFVEFESSESAAAAMNTKHPLMLDNRQLRLELETKKFSREGDDGLLDEEALREQSGHGNRLLVRVKPRMHPKDSLEEALRPIASQLIEVSAPRDGGASFLVSFASPEALQAACTALNDQTVRIRTRSYQLSCTIDAIDALWHIAEEDMRKLKRWAFRGRTEIVTTAAQIAPAVQLLLDGRPLSSIRMSDPVFLGLDAEWRPVFIKGTAHPIAMLQFASRNAVVLFRLHQLEDEFYQLNPQAQEFALPKLLEQLLTSPVVRKLGVGLRDDAAKINAEFGLKCDGITDISDLPQTKRCKPQSLQGLTALFLGFYHDKSASKTNWEAEQLSQRQILYAATDAWVSRELYFVMKDLPLVKPM